MYHKIIKNVSFGNHSCSHFFVPIWESYYKSVNYKGCKGNITLQKVFANHTFAAKKT